jgi:hypothetical protein
MEAGTIDKIKNKTGKGLNMKLAKSPTHYIINGKPQSGKDTFVDELINLMDSDNLKADKMSSVGSVKIAAIFLGWDGNKDEKGRNFLSDLKDLSTKYYDGPFNEIKEAMSLNPEYTFFFFIREPREIEKLIDSCGKGKFKTVCVVREIDNSNRITNHADQNVYDFEYDHIILNNGTLDDFKQSAENFYKTVIKKQ